MIPRRETVTSRSEAETSDVARRLARALQPGAVVLLYGELGAGKTAFVRGLADGLGIDPDDVTSPTFTLIQEYRGVVTLYHVDLYRVSPEEVEELGLQELVGPGSIVAVEWADRLPRPLSPSVSVTLESAAGRGGPLGPPTVRVTLEDLGGDERRIAIYSSR